MGMKKNFLYFMTAFVLLFASACKEPDNSGSGGENPEDATYHRIVKETGEKIWSAKEQVVVLPDKSDELTEKAGLEFIDLFKQATDISAGLEYESDVTVEKDCYYYFIGHTAALDENEIDYSYSLLGDSGVVIQTIENAVYMTGATEKGTLYAVYEYMNRAFGYEFYAADEVFIGDGTDADWLAFDYVYRPSIKFRCLLCAYLF